MRTPVMPTYTAEITWDEERGANVLTYTERGATVTVLLRIDEAQMDWDHDERKKSRVRITAGHILDCSVSLS